MRRLATILIHPRETMRAILDGPRDRMVMPLVLLATASGMIGDGDVRGAQLALSKHSVGMQVLIGAGILVACLLVGVLLFYAFGWVATWVGRLFEGTGDGRSVRSAVAWGLVPVIWAILYRLPAALLHGGNVNSRTRGLDDGLLVIPSRFAGGCAVAMLLLVLELVVFGWYVFVASNTLAEAHRFSPMRGFATLLLSVLSPVVIVAAAILAFS
jgi:hypothetical protein